MNVAGAKDRLTYLDIMGREGEFAGSLEAHVAGLGLNIEIHFHSASTSGEIVRSDVRVVR